MIAALSDVGLGTVALLAFVVIVAAVWLVSHHLHRRRGLWSITTSTTFQRSDVDRVIAGVGIPPGSTVGSFIDHHHVTVLPPPVFYDWEWDDDSIRITRERWDSYLSVSRRSWAEDESRPAHRRCAL